MIIWIFYLFYVILYMQKYEVTLFNINHKMDYMKFNLFIFFFFEEIWSWNWSWVVFYLIRLDLPQYKDIVFCGYLYKIPHYIHRKPTIQWKEKYSLANTKERLVMSKKESIHIIDTSWLHFSFLFRITNLIIFV